MTGHDGAGSATPARSGVRGKPLRRGCRRAWRMKRTARPGTGNRPAAAGRRCRDRALRAFCLGAPRAAPVETDREPHLGHAVFRSRIFRYDRFHRLAAGRGLSPEAEPPYMAAGQGESACARSLGSSPGGRFPAAAVPALWPPQGEPVRRAYSRARIEPCLATDRPCHARQHGPRRDATAEKYACPLPCLSQGSSPCWCWA